MTSILNAITQDAEQVLVPALASESDQAKRAELVKQFTKKHDHLIHELHNQGAGGLLVAGARSHMLDVVLKAAYNEAWGRLGASHKVTLAVTSVGGYGRGLLNPSSDIDLLFLVTVPSHKIQPQASAIVQEILYLLWDTGFKVGHATRSISECIDEANTEQQSKTALMDARLLAGDQPLFEQFTHRFQRESLQKHPEAFFELRRQDIRSRHFKYSHTVFLQEPHVKESCGGLRDFQNIIWVAEVKRGTKDLMDLVNECILTQDAYDELTLAFDFLHRVRNELHYHTKRGTDILTLQLQGVVATNFKYPEKSILRRCESFMRDYYRHTRAIYHHTTSLMEIFQLELQDVEVKGWRKLFSKPKKNREEFDAFIASNGMIFPKNNDIFVEDPNRLMRLFQHCQIKDLKLSPQMRKLVKANWSLVDHDFRHQKANRETFRAMLERKGDVASTLRRMHRVGILGLWMPEFGALDCLVQHEFFHRYTADEHTLRCIEQLDALIEDQRPEREVYRRILTDVEDPYALYLALILHDTGRAENVREHTDGSAILAARVCSRFKISGERRSLLTFLVDHHLTFWRHATTRNLEDPAVIEEFAHIMRDKSRLRTMLLFTYADSNGTNEEAWSPWKESLMLQLFHSTLEFFERGKEQYHTGLQEQIDKLKSKTRSRLKEEYHQQLEDHFERMPRGYFRFRASENIAIHIRAVRRFLIKHENAENGQVQQDLRWITREDRAYTELIVTTWNFRYLIEKVTCALASCEINIIAADVYTRTDSVVCDIFQVCTADHKPVNDPSVRSKVEQIFCELIQHEHYDASKYLQRKRNFLRKDKNEGALPFPVRAIVNNLLSKQYTAIEIQALDRIGLLHDIFLHIGKCGLATVHARICTEKGAAMDTIYVSNLDGTKVTDPAKLNELETSMEEIVGCEHS